jgi:MIP family channel proteins
MKGGHLNPAVSFSQFLLGRISFFKFVLYSVAQTLGAFLASLMVFFVYLNHINEYKEKDHINKWKRFDPMRDFDVNSTNSSNQPGCYSMELAPIFATYPKDSAGQWSLFSNFFDQFFSTSLFIVAILVITDKRNTHNLPPQLISLLIGVSLVAVGTSFGVRGFAVNPARDFGPRLFTLVAGWCVEPFLSHDCYFWIPIVAPIFGSGFGTLMYSLFFSNLVFNENSAEVLSYNSFN